jgi:hypothetical protein
VVYKKINNEHVIISKPINLVGISNPTIYNEVDDPEVILVNGSNVSIKGFSLKAKRTQQTISISGNKLSYITICDNNIKDGFKAMSIKNISIFNNIITQDTIRNAIHLVDCSEISLINNLITDPNGDSSGVGIFLGNCNLNDNLKVIGNNISNVIIGVEICSINDTDNSVIEEVLNSNNISNVNHLKEYDVRITCD